MKPWYEFKSFIDFYEFVNDLECVFAEKKQPYYEYSATLPKQIDMLYKTWDTLSRENNFLTLKFLLNMFEWQFEELKKPEEAE